MRPISALVFLSLLDFVNFIAGQSNAVDASPFFFNCKQFDRLPDNWDPNESSMKIAQMELSGNPRSYVGGQVYKVTVRLLEDFDSAMITGVYSATPSGSIIKQTSQGKRKMCNILHSYAKRRPTDERRVDFRWMAPPEDMGCIDFVGTFTRQETILLKDERIFHLCPQYEELDAESVTLSGVNQEGGVIFRDDFETGYFTPSLWTESKGFQVSNSCQPIFHGLPATVCNKPGESPDSNVGTTEFHLSTVALNLTSAGTLQFIIGQTSCTVGDQDMTASMGLNANITIFYGQLTSPYDTECSNWKPLQTIASLPKTRELASYVFPLLSPVRQPETCLRWSVEIVENQTVCFGVDDVIVTNTADRPSELHADFDPLNTVDWLSLPGGKIHSGCKGSKGGALVFNANQHGPNWASTRDLQLISNDNPISSDQILWRPDFDALLLDEHWEFQNARTDAGCENEKRILILQQSSNSSLFSACSPPINLSLAGNLRFHLKPFNSCEIKQTKNAKTSTKSAKRTPSKLNVWIERFDVNRKKLVILSGLVLDNVPVAPSISIPNEAQEKDARICWQLLGEPLSEKEMSPWSVDDIQLLPTLPSPIQHILQFRLNMACGLSGGNMSSLNNTHLVKEENSFHVLVQYSTDQGSSWNSLHNLCLPPTCTGALSDVIQTTWSSQEMAARPWDRITLPVSFASMAESVRFRFIQKGRSTSSVNIKHWAVDDINLEECSMGCSGHGTCIEKGFCSCDDGYHGDWCQHPVHPLPSTLRENFEHETSISNTFARFLGHKLSARCGQVGAGLAAVFDQPGSRQLMTLDLDTTESHILRFALRMNGPGSQLHQHCPGPDRLVETIYVHSSCNGGITWTLLKFIEPYQTKEESTRLIRIQLTSEAQGPSCRFRIWQAQHSGPAKDVWAIDDLYVGPNLTQTLTRNSSSGSSFPTTADAFVGRHAPETFCKRDGVMVLQADEGEETYPVRIEPFSVIQLELAVGCSLSTPLLNNNSILVQFSVDGGKHWNDLDDSRRHVSFLQDWRRIGIKLPPASWSEATRFRIAQTGSRPSDRSALGVDYFYAGPDECPELCRGNGRCALSGCVCDDGFSGESCLPDSPLFPLTASDLSLALTIGGRDYLMDHDGCLVRGTHNIMLDGLGMRYLETKEISYSPGIVVMFFLRLGFCESSQIGSQHDVFVQMEISWNGIDWKLLREYRSPFFSQPQFEQIEILPSKSIRSQTHPSPFKIRFVQTGIHGKDRNVWSVAGLASSSQADVLTGSDIGKLESPLIDNTDFWLVRNDPDPKSSCLVFDTSCLSKIAWYGALTKKLFLDVGDTIQFDVVVQSVDSTTFSDGAEQILLEYSADGGVDWQLVQPECLHTWSNCLGFYESSRLDYRSFTSSKDANENRFNFRTSEAMANKPILLRWLHHRLGDQQHHPLRGFQIQNLYIGNPCPSLCSGHGRCWNSVCSCEAGYSGNDCSETEETKIAGFYDTFVYKEHVNSSPKLRPHWGRIVGGKLMPNYCDGSTDGVVFFASRGPRSLQTLEIDTRNLRMVQFTLAVTSVSIYKQNCRLAAKRKSLSLEIPTASLLVLDYSNDNGLTWNTVETWPLNSEIDEKRIGFSLPDSARTARTKIRWWQLTYPNANNRDGLQWYLDDVLVNLNITNPVVFEYENQSDEPVQEHQSRDTTDGSVKDGTITDWMGWQGLVFREPLDPVDTLLGPADLEDGSSLSYAETWDMEITDPTFAQFQLILPEEHHLRNVEVRFEYSTDMGRHWSLVELECYMLHQLSQQCEYLHPPSRYFLNVQNNASRITVHLPRRSITESTRFRWISENGQDRGPTVWGIERVYIGGTCPWMCSGHGTCKNGQCSCDAGYGNLDCVPIEPLPRRLTSHFDWDSNLVRISGGGISTGCGVLMSGPAAIFHKDGLRYFESIDLDLTAASYAQMTIKFNCWAELESYANSLEPSHQRLLLQYSVNGGITWILIQEIKVHPQQDPQLLIMNLMRIPDLTNCTRLRLWQPVHAGEGWDTWAIDGLVLHSTTPLGVIMTSNFQNPSNDSSTWLTWFGGQVQSFCSRDDALVFHGELGEQQVFTGDAMIAPESVLQFEVNVGCGTADPNLEYPIRLEYSNDGGQDWHLVVNDNESSRNPYDRMPHQMPTVYSSKTTNAWKRETVMLSHLETSKAIRFRWYQGYLNGTYRHSTPQWAIRNVILSPQCPELCNGHGKCTQEGSCECDGGYQGEACETVTYSTLNPQDFHESFITAEDPLENFNWIRRIGGEVRDQSSRNIGIGGAFIMDRVGVRMLETRDLDLSNANFVQFHLDSSESIPSEDETFVILDYSINGGIEWTTFEVFPLDGLSIQQLHQVPIPSRALSLATRLKWSQLGGRNGNFHNTWAIDEIFIGGEYFAKSSVEDDFTSIETTRSNWLFFSGGTLEPSCGSSNSTLHFPNPNGKSSMAMTKDIKVVDHMYLQYATSSGCDHPNACNRVRLEFSDNYGLVWRNLPDECLPGEEVDCNAFEYHTELLSRATGYRRSITVPIPVNKGVIRFRWISDDESVDWTLHWVYIGAACGHCNGRGRCWEGSCQCHREWTGKSCEISSTKLFSSVRETFNNSWNSSILWSRINGGSVSSLCGNLDSGPALHFHEACDRYAETLELDLREVIVVQFHLRSACGKVQSSPNHGVLLFQFSLNGGVKWQPGLTISLSQFQDSKLVSFFVPDEAQTNAVKLRWWQLGQTGRMTEDWAIDSFIIDRPLNISLTALKILKQGKIPSRDLDSDYQAEEPEEPVNPTHMRQSLDGHFGQKLWWRNINVEQHDSFCGQRGHIMRGRSNAVEESILETSDFWVVSAKSHILSFDLIVGDCGHGSDSVELSTTPLKFPVRFEVSYDHGITWKLFHPLKVRGEKGQGPQIPSVYPKLDKWQTYQYSLELICGARFARFRWRHPKSSFSVSWAINDFDMGSDIKNPVLVGLQTLSDDFNDGTTVKPHWRFFSGGKIVHPNERLGDGTAGLFQGPGIKLLQTVALDLTFGRNVEFILNFQLNKGRRDNEDMTQNVFLQCSPDNGFKWILIQDYFPQHYINPSSVHAVIPEDCQNFHSILRWWQSVGTEAETIKKSPMWLIDNIAIEYSREQLTEIYDKFGTEPLNQTQWQFHPNGVISNNICGKAEVESSLNFISSENNRLAGITSRHVRVKDNYAVYFKIRTSCGLIPCHANNRSQIRFEMRQGYEQPYWSLAKPNCFPSSTNSLCEPQMYHSSSAYTFDNFPTWQRVIIPLKSIPFSNTWQFRWITQKNGIGRGEKNTWAIKDVYIGRMCPSHCHGHGDCFRGRCLCDNGYEGLSCASSDTVLSVSLLPVMDHFDDIVNPPTLWESITGGSIKIGCGSLIPLAHGKHLHFDGCGTRMASTVPMDVGIVSGHIGDSTCSLVLYQQRRVAFVIRIGTPQQIPSCRIQPSTRSDIFDRTVLLQYSYNGVDWPLLASHGIRNFIQPQRMIYNVPVQINSSTVQFRWWQPQHGGSNWDQWALDNVEILI